MLPSTSTLSHRAVLCALVLISDILLPAHGARNINEASQSALQQEPDESPSLHFVAIGDWGAPLTSHRQRHGQQAVADGVASWLEQATKENNDRAGDSDSRDNTDPFILSLGDNFYPFGVKDADDMAERFDESFEDVYSHDAFDNVPWYVVAGNKDYENGSDVTAQMNFSGSSRWVFPDYFHRVIREVRVPGDDDVGGKMKVEIIMIDTMQLSRDMKYVKAPEIGDRGLEFIKNHLKISDADYLLVAGHFPAHSIHGLEELLQTHKVSAYVGGHIHCQKHKQKHGVDYFISGAGMELDCVGDTIDDEDGIGGFLSFHARVDKMVVRFHDQSGNELQQVEISPRLGYERGGRLGEAIEIA